MATNEFKGLVTPLDSEATEKPQPSKSFNAGSETINGANPSSPSTNNATRREKYANYLSGLDTQQKAALGDEALKYKGSGLTQEQILEKIIPNTATNQLTPGSTPTSQGYDLSIKGNFDVYSPIDWQNQPELMQQYYVQANNDIKSARRSLSQYMLQQDALESKSSNVNQVTTIIDAIENAYDKGIFDTDTIANTLGIDREIVSLIQQGKANELVTLNQEYVQDQLKSYYRAEEDYDTNLQRTIEDYQLAKTNLDSKYNSAMQTLKRNLFDDKRAASVGSAVAGISGSEYAIRTIEAKHQQNMDDLENNYLYSSMTQKYSYTRAIEDYNKNIERLSEDFDDALKSIQSSVLQQFQEIDSKIGLTTAQLAQAYGTLEQNVATAKAKATTDYLTAMSNNETQLMDAISNAYGLDTNSLTSHKFSNSELGRVRDPATGKYNTTIGNAVNSIGHILASNDGMSIGTYSPGTGYTYNVYATRQDGLQATIGLLQRGYYGMTLQDAAQKWIGQGKDITTAKNMIKSQGLSLTDRLSDDNIQKFITAIGRWEGTLSKDETLEDWLKGGQDLSSYKQTTATAGGDVGTYKASDEGLYKAYLTKGLSGVQEKQIKADSSYGSTADERWQNFKAAAEMYKAEETKGIKSNLQDSINQIETLKASYENATSNMNEYLIKQAVNAFKKGGQWEVNAAAAYPDLYTAYTLYNQRIAQGFIDTIISSKQQGASYGQLSDNEGKSLREAFTNVNFYLGKDTFIKSLQSMEDNLQKNIDELGKIPSGTSTGSGTSSLVNTITAITGLDKWIEAIGNTYSGTGININESVFTGGTNTGAGLFDIGGTNGTGSLLSGSAEQRTPRTTTME